MLNRKLSVAMILAAAIAGPATAGIVFNVDEGVVDGALANVITADKVTFTYVGSIIQGLVGAPPIDGNDPFTETGSISATSFVLGNTPQNSQLTAIGSNDYNLLGTFTATGFAGYISGTQVEATFTSFVLSLGIDANSNGSLLDSGDEILGTAVMNGFSNAHLFPGGGAQGDYAVNLLFTPTAYGETFFIVPDPFTLNMRITGVTTSIQLTSGVPEGPFSANVGGDGNITFGVIPEPGSMALVGLGLLGLGVIRRRKSTAA